jgi:type II secretory ATPase GspE/PulE/Tfp pilus assembly ATPase PilB-like protein
MSPVHTRLLTSILLEANVVKPEQIDAGLIRQRSTGLRIGETLVEMGVATEEDIGWALARQLNLPFVDPRPEALDRELIQSFPEGLLHRLDAVPLVDEGTTLSVALADPLDNDVLEELERAAGRPLTLGVATPSAIRRVLRDILGPRHDVPPVSPVVATDQTFDIQWDRSGASFLQFHLDEARRARASQIHFLAGRGSLEVHHRIGERLVRVRSEPPGAIYYLLGRIEALGGPVIDDRVPHVARRVVCPAGTEAVDLGVSLLHQEEGVSVTLDLRPVPMRSLALEELGFDPQDLARLRETLDAPAGLGIVAGPPRAGGSTTLACLLAEAGTTERRCLAFGMAAARVPAQVNVPGSAAEAAQVWAGAALAQCADIVVLDGVLTGAAVTAALSPEAAGRLLLVRTDWTDTFAMLEHLAERAQGRAALAERLRFVVQQRLPRVEGDGAPADGSGRLRDRRAVFEVLFAEESLRAALRAGEPAARLRARAEAAGFRPLARQLDGLVAAGTVRAAEAARHLA